MKPYNMQTYRDIRSKVDRLERSRIGENLFDGNLAKQKFRPVQVARGTIRTVICLEYQFGVWFVLRP